MATSDGSQRKKRAWRKPREAIGPGGEKNSETKQVIIKINRDSLKSDVNPAGEKLMDDDSSCRNDKDAGKRVQKDESPMETETHDSSSKSVTKLSNSLRPHSHSVTQQDGTSPVEIDGSVLEGVCMYVYVWRI